MVSLQTPYSTVRYPPSPLFTHPRRRQCFQFRSRRNCANSSLYSPGYNVKLAINNLNLPEQTPRTLFPGGFKRPEIKVPGLVLKLSCEDVLRDEKFVNEIDQAISGRVDVVVLSGDGASGGKLYEAACLLKSVIKGRAYLLIDGRVDIAAAVSASGVLLSDQDLPAIVARNTLMDSKSEELVVLPLVARIVQTPTAAVDASNSEGADFLIYEVGVNSEPEDLVSSVFEHVKIPVFVTIGSLGDQKLFDEASNLLESGASGIVISMENLRSVSDDDFGKLFYGAYSLKKKTEEESQSNSRLNSDLGNGFPSTKKVAGFIELRDRERQLLEKERLVLHDTINVIESAAPMMEEISLLKDAVSQLDEPFLLVIVGEFNSGKSTFINALLGKKYLKDGVVPTTNEITFLRYSDVDESQRCERHPDGQYVCYLPVSVLEEMIIVDTPGTNVILQRQQRLTEEFVPRADLLLFVMSADRPLTESEMIIVDTLGTNVILQRQQRLTEEFVPRADLLLFVMSADPPLTESESFLGNFSKNWSFRPFTRLRPCISQERNGILLGKNKNYTSFVGYNGVPLTEISCMSSDVSSQNELPPLVSALKASAEENAACFHFPGHNRGHAAPSSLTQLIGAKPFLHDLPELPELDNLFSPEGPIYEAQKRAARLFGASETWFLVGGSTCGIHAAIMATCSPGDTLILPRNSHISAISAMVLSGALPKYIIPQYDFKWDVAGGITPAQVNDAIKELEMGGQKAAALLVVSPTYHGICSNIDEICHICHSHNIPVIVDEAHGAHLGFHPELPYSSLSQGADLAVQSTHKVLCALTQSSMLHMQGNLVNREKISKSLQMLQSSSPSYLLLASLDAARAQLSENREAIFDKAIDLALEARSLISKIPGISILEFPSFSSFFHIDPLRLTIGVCQLGLSGFEADDILCNDFGIVCELVGTKSFTLAFNLGTQRDHVLRLVAGLKHLSQTSHFPQPVNDEGKNINHFVCLDDVRISMSPREAFFATKREVSIRDSLGEICGELICPYPPGIPVLIPGEIITEEALSYLLEIKSKGAVITGAADCSLSSFVVCVA